MNWEYLQPVRIRFGEGMVRVLPDEIKNFGCHAGMLVTSRGFVKRGMAQQIVNLSDGLIKSVFGEVSPNPDVKECDACAEIIRREQLDFVVAVGGGSVMDLAKAAATISLTNEPVTNYVGTGKALPQAHLPLICVPTTAGTGSEITCVSVLTDHERGVKAPMNSDGFYPRLAIVDPELTLSAPQHLTACTGMDVLCHATEAYWSKHHQPICDALAVHAARLVLDNLERAWDNGADRPARAAMCEASVTAGLAFTMPKTTSAHACSYPLTNRLGIAHGEACGLTISYFMRLNARHGCQRVHDFARLLGFDDAQALADCIDGMKRHMHLMSDLKQFGLSGERLETIIQESKHPNLLNNPVEITEQMLREMYGSMI